MYGFIYFFRLKSKEKNRLHWPYLSSYIRYDIWVCFLFAIYDNNTNNQNHKSKREHEKRPKQTRLTLKWLHTKLNMWQVFENCVCVCVYGKPFIKICWYFCVYVKRIMCAKRMHIIYVVIYWLLNVCSHKNRENTKTKKMKYSGIVLNASSAHIHRPKHIWVENYNNEKMKREHSCGAERI